MTSGKTTQYAYLISADEAHGWRKYPQWSHMSLCCPNFFHFDALSGCWRCWRRSVCSLELQIKRGKKIQQEYILYTATNSATLQPTSIEPCSIKLTRPAVTSALICLSGTARSQPNPQMCFCSLPGLVLQHLSQHSNNPPPTADRSAAWRYYKKKGISSEHSRHCVQNQNTYVWKASVES